MDVACFDLFLYGASEREHVITQWDFPDSRKFQINAKLKLGADYLGMSIFLKASQMILSTAPAGCSES